MLKATGAEQLKRKRAMFKFISMLILATVLVGITPANAHDDDTGWGVGMTVLVSGMCFTQEPLVRVASATTGVKAQAIYNAAMKDGDCIDFPYSKRPTRLLTSSDTHFTIPGRKGTMSLWTYQASGYPVGYGLIVDRKVAP